MIDSHLKEIAEKTLIDVIEQHFFLLLDPPPEVLPETLPSDYYAISMAFTGDHNGVFLLLLPKSAAAEAYSGMTGLNEPGTETEIIDTANEVLNYLGPNILIQWAERTGRPAFQASIPECRKVSPENWQQLKAKTNYVSLAVNAEPIVLFMELRDMN